MNKINDFLYNDFNVDFNGCHDPNNILTCLNNYEYYKQAVSNLTESVDLYRDDDGYELIGTVEKYRKEINELKNLISIYKTKLNEYIDVKKYTNKLDDYLTLKKLIESIYYFFKVFYPFFADKYLLGTMDINYFDDYFEIFEDAEDFTDEEINNLNIIDIIKIRKIIIDLYLENIKKFLNLIDNIDYNNYYQLITKDLNTLINNKFKCFINNEDFYSMWGEEFFKELINKYKHLKKEYKNDENKKEEDLKQKKYKDKKINDINKLFNDLFDNFNNLFDEKMNIKKNKNMKQQFNNIFIEFFNILHKFFIEIDINNIYKI